LIRSKQQSMPMLFKSYDPLVADEELVSLATLSEELVDAPTGRPTPVPTEAPTGEPTKEPTVGPTQAPAVEAMDVTKATSKQPAGVPTQAPPKEPTGAPQKKPRWKSHRPRHRMDQWKCQLEDLRRLQLKHRLRQPK
jgi:hypothetical protein